ncbi:2-amino-4-hydroxy-6-hydroxymethyldihydropteridine diphosphokinase [Chitinimonas sp.]|uniref:2-amino-4-hydroxy-6- hydroxymethyldihydropteridine diphosphokinase n=1 Tax=Chitinimonas sp. TaxID=1934313 RepID=UPI002F91D531
MSVRAFIGLGANLGDAQATVRAAMAALGELPQTRLVATSSLYRSAPVGYLDQPDFINAVAAIDTELAPHALLDGLLGIEQVHGRQRSFRNAPRTLDMDLLLYGERQLHDERLTVPHPRMLERGFVLLPLAEIAAGLQLPDGRALATLTAGCDQTGLQRIE